MNEFKEIFSGKGKIDEATWKDVFHEADENNDNFVIRFYFSQIITS